MEQFKALLENSIGLTDDFKKSAEPIFQEAVEAVVAERLDEECKKAVEKALKEKYGATAGYLNDPRHSEVAQGRWLVC